MKKLTKATAPSRAKYDENYITSISAAKPTPKPVDHEARLELVRKAAEKRQPMYGLLLSVDSWQ